MKLKDQIQKLTGKLYCTCGELTVLLKVLAQASKGQSEVIPFIQDIKNYEPDRVNIYYNYRLHAKILLGKKGGFFGSANVTQSGLNYNDKLLFYVTDEKILDKLHSIAKKLAQFDGDCWKKKSNNYSLFYEYRNQSWDEALLKKIIISKELQEDLTTVLELLSLTS